MRDKMIENMYVKLPDQLEPFKTPFDEDGRVSVPCKFIYMTNRYNERYSGLLPMDFNMGWELMDYFPMGYTQLWMIEKLYSLHPKVEESTHIEKRNHNVKYPLERNQWVNRLYLVFREPVGKYPHNDIIAAKLSEADAIKRAKSYTTRYNRRSVVGLLIGDMAWH